MENFTANKSSPFDYPISPLLPHDKKRPHGISQSISSPCNYRLRLQQPSQPNNRSQSSTTAHPPTHPFPRQRKTRTLPRNETKRNKSKQNTALPANNNIILLFSFLFFLFLIPWPTSERIRQTPSANASSFFLRLIKIKIQLETR